MHARTWLVGVSVLAIAPVLAARSPQDVATPVVNITAEELERLPSGRNIGDLLKALPCSSQTVPTLARPRSGALNAPGSLSCIRPADIRMVEIYRIHNATRAQFGSQPLVWDPALAAAAQSYAGHLARTGILAHAPREGRGNSRENLSEGMLNWDNRQMLANWLREQSRFRPGVYPNVSTTGRWDDVSHFTQMVWPKTVSLGCGMADGSGHRWLVCRYAPGGNKEGHYLGPMTGLRNDAGKAVGPVTPPPPPPPPPNARDPAPDGEEFKHPLIPFAGAAYDAFTDAWRNGDRVEQERELAKLRYALDELRKRLKAARKAGPYSTVDPAKVEKEVKALERMVERAENRFKGREEFG